MPVALKPDIFKAYDVRGLYPDEINEPVARSIGAAFVAYLKAQRIAVSRDMRPIARTSSSVRKGIRGVSMNAYRSVRCTARLVASRSLRKFRSSNDIPTTKPTESAKAWS